MRLFSLFCLLLFSVSCCASDSDSGGSEANWRAVLERRSNSDSVGSGGSLRPLPGHHPALRMESENIRITFDADSDYGYSVLVDTVFLNQGPTRTVAMGVPESDISSPDEAEDLSNLTVRVDGKSIPTRRQIVWNKQTTEMNFDAISMIKVHFRAGQRRSIRVRYRSHVWGSCTKALEYAFSAHQWRGKVAHTSVTLTNGAGCLVDYEYKYSGRAWTGWFLSMRERKQVSYYQWKNWIPKGQIMVN